MDWEALYQLPDGPGLDRVRSTPGPTPAEQTLYDITATPSVLNVGTRPRISTISKGERRKQKRRAEAAATRFARMGPAVTQNNITRGSGDNNILLILIVCILETIDLDPDHSSRSDSDQ